MNNFVGNILRN